jgi:hypothetical protein
MTRQPLMVSMRGMTGALQGLQAGDQKQFEEGYQQYKVNLDAALRQNDQKIKEFDRIVKSKEFSIREMDAQIKALLRQQGDEMGSAMVPFKDRLDHIEQQRKAGEKLRAESLKLEEVKIKLRMEAERNAETANYHRKMLDQKGETGTKKGAAEQKLAMLDRMKAEGRLTVNQHEEAVNRLISGNPTVAEERASAQSVTMNLANSEIDGLLARGVRLPMLAEMHQDGNGFFSVAKANGVRRALTPDEQQLLTATMLMGESVGHMMSGARITDAGFRRTLEEFGPQSGDSDERLAMKKAHRDAQGKAASMLSGRLSKKTEELQKTVHSGVSGTTPQIPNAAQQQSAPTATVKGKTYAKPPGMSDADWNAYKQEVGAK